MTVYLIVDAAKAPAVAASYLAANIRTSDNPNEAEKIAWAWNASGTQAFTGTSRATLTQAVGVIAAHAPGVTATEDPAFLETWEWPTP